MHSVVTACEVQENQWKSDHEGLEGERKATKMDFSTLVTIRDMQTIRSWYDVSVIPRLVSIQPGMR